MALFPDESQRKAFAVNVLLALSDPVRFKHCN